jgi:hypothetical protein
MDRHCDINPFCCNASAYSCHVPVDNIAESNNIASRNAGHIRPLFGILSQILAGIRPYATGRINDASRFYDDIPPALDAIARGKARETL